MTCLSKRIKYMDPVAVMVTGFFFSLIDLKAIKGSNQGTGSPD